MEYRDHTPSSYTVGELTRQIKSLLESELPPLWLHGELSNFVRHSSGHMYFSLKDENAQISCVMWRSRNAGLFFTPQDGMQVLAFGQVSVYEKRGNYQFDTVKMIPAGVGQLQMAFERLKNRLAAEGLFDAARKQVLPAFPETIGIITSPTGAAIRDLIQVLRRRMPSVHIILRPALVQGDGAAEDIAAAIREFNEYGGVDVIIAGRGGGSLEDLWAFNEEVVARAIAASGIPVVSAVGHEVDYTIADFVADLRAPTPSAAAELVVPESAQVRAGLGEMARHNQQLLRRMIKSEKQRLAGLRSSYGLRRPQDLIQQRHQRVDELTRAVHRSMSYYLENKHLKLAALQQRNRDLAPESILKRGYSLVWKVGHDRFVRAAAALNTNDTIAVQFAAGRIRAQVRARDPQKQFTELFTEKCSDGQNDL